MVIFKRIALGLVLGVLSGCATGQYRPPATTVRYQEMLGTWKNRDINELITAWGPPSSTYTMPNGNKMFTWANIKVGPTITSGSGFASADPNGFGGAYGYGHSNAVSFTPTWDCFTTAVTNSSGTIVSWTLKGNDCVLSYTDEELKKKLEALQTLCGTLHKGDIIRLKPYEHSNDESTASLENRDVYFQGYNKMLDQISFSENAKRIALIEDEYFHLEFLEDILIVPKKD